MNLPLIIAVAILAFALVIFLIIRNKKDGEKLKDQLGNDYPKPRSEEGDIDIDEFTNKVH